MAAQQPELQHREAQHDGEQHPRHGRGRTELAEAASLTQHALDIATRLTMPGIVAATLWYLIVCSILMVGQAWLERYFGRGFGAVPTRTQQKLTKIEADH